MTVLSHVSLFAEVLNRCDIDVVAIACLVPATCGTHLDTHVSKWMLLVDITENLNFISCVDLAVAEFAIVVQSVKVNVVAHKVNVCIYVLVVVESFNIFQEISTSTISHAAIQVNALDNTVTAVSEFIDTLVATASE
jgi:hypothetical protein